MHATLGKHSCISESLSIKFLSLFYFHLVILPDSISIGFLLVHFVDQIQPSFLLFDAFVCKPFLSLKFLDPALQLYNLVILPLFLKQGYVHAVVGRVWNRTQTTGQIAILLLDLWLLYFLDGCLHIGQWVDQLRKN